MTAQIDLDIVSALPSTCPAGRRHHWFPGSSLGGFVVVGSKRRVVRQQSGQRYRFCRGYAGWIQQGRVSGAPVIFLIYVVWNRSRYSLRLRRGP